MQNCALPLEVVKRVMTSNIKDIQANIKDCINDCHEGIVLPSKDADPKIRKEHELMFAEEIYSCKHKCLETNKKIINGLEDKLVKELPLYKDDLFGIHIFENRTNKTNY